MKRCVNLAVLFGSLTTAALLVAQTPPRMALPTGGLNPPAMSSTQPAKNTAPTAINTAPAASSTAPAAMNSVQPVSGTPVKTAAATTAAPAMLTSVKSEMTPAKPVLVAAQPAVTATPAAAAPTSPLNETLTAAAPTVAPAVTAQAAPAPTSNLFDPAPAETKPAAPQPEWRYAPKIETPRTTREYRTAMMQPEARSPNRIRDCLLKPIAEVQLPAQEAGVLVDLQAFEGQDVKQNQPLGRVDDAQPRLQRKAAEAEKAVTFEKSKSTIKERFAAKASDVALKEWEKAVESNKRAPGSVSEVEVMRLKLTWEKGQLEIEQAQEDRKVDSLSVMAKNVDVEAADDAIRRRQLIAPIAGTIVELTPHVGEWLKPGDPVLKIVNMEVLKIEGYVNIDHFRQDQLRNQTVIALVDLGNKQQVEVHARITFVSPVVEPGGEYRIKAEIQNRKNQAGEWELKPGLNAELILNAAAPAGAPRLP